MSARPTTRASTEKPEGEELVAIHDSGVVAGVFRERRGVRTMTYEPGWRALNKAVALSLSMPLARSTHSDAAVDAWLWGLLPDNEMVLERWGRHFQVSARNPFRLLAHVGEDCAGAFQLVPPARVAHLTSSRPEVPEVHWLDERDVGARLRAVRDDPSRTRKSTDEGQFSLAGAQPKLALLREGERWGVPAGRTPTTHILKPPTGDFDGFAENEHFCLRLASKLGLAVARSEVRRFDDQICIVLERYDRERRTPREGAKGSRVVSSVRRIHQEDLCQALGMHPGKKYQSEGGPSAADVAGVLRRASTDPVEDVGAFVDALAFAFLTGGTDAHAKNYSLLHSAHGRVRLAPLYDLATALPYPQLSRRRLKLAMSIGGRYRLREVTARHVRALSEHVGFSPEEVVERFVGMAERLPDATHDVAAELHGAGLDHPIVRQVEAQITTWAREAEGTLR